MGRWVTSKGRRIYIPDEGEENPFAKEGSSKKSKTAGHDAKEKNTLENRNKLKKKIDDYVKAHPNPTSEDRRKVSEMRDRYDAMKKEAYDSSKKEQKERIAIIQDVKKNTAHRKQEIKDIYYNQELELYKKEKQIASNKAQANERNGKKTLAQNKVQEKKESGKSLVSKSSGSLKTMYKNASTEEERKRILAELNSRGFYTKNGKWTSKGGGR